MLQQMFNLTCTFCEASVREENVSFRKTLLRRYQLIHMIELYSSLN